MGVVITGDRGVGKTQVGRTAVMGFGPDVYTLQLRSPGSGIATPVRVPRVHARAVAAKFPWLADCHPARHHLPDP